MATKTAKKPVTTAGCVHHWLIENAQGPTAGGACKRCGETRTFNVSPVRVEWN